MPIFKESEMTEWYPGNTYPERTGWYLRDHRGVRDYTNDTDRKISFDYFIAEDNPNDSLYPGVWYVYDLNYSFLNPFTGEWSYSQTELNDASQQNIPWRGLTYRAYEDHVIFKGSGAKYYD